MDEHTNSFNNVHTQLLLQMQNNSNIKDIKNDLRSTQNELISTKSELISTKGNLAETKTELETSKRNQTATEEELKKAKTELEISKRNQAAIKATLATTQNELLTTRLKFEQTMDQLRQSKEDLKTKEKQLKFQQENIQQQIEKGFMLNHQITEKFAKFYLEQNQNLNNLNSFHKALDIKPTKPIMPIEINGTKLEFPNINALVQSYEEKFQLLLNKMKNGQIYDVKNQQLIFKLCIPKNHQKLFISHQINIASLPDHFPDKEVVMNDQLVLLDDNNCNGYGIILQIPNYNNNNSKCYLFCKNTNGENFLLKYGDWNYNINYDDYKTESNEILFHIIMN